MAEREKRRATTFRTSKGTIVNVAAPTVYVSPAFLSTDDVTNPTELREALREELVPQHPRRKIVVATPAVNDPLPDYEAPISAVRCENDDILILFRKGTTHSSMDGEIWMTRSSDNGLSWSSPVRLVPNPAPYSMGTTCAGVSRDGTVLFLYDTQDITGVSHGIYMIRSFDHGVTWSSPSIVPTPLNNNCWYVFNQMFLDDEGYLLVPCYGANTGESWRAMLVRTLQGDAWTSPYSTIAYDATGTIIFNEATIAYPSSSSRLVKNRMIAIVRTGTPTEGVFYKIESTDDGATWGAYEELACEPWRGVFGASPNLLLIENGVLLFAHRIRIGNYYNPIGLSVSVDGGLTFVGTTLVDEAVNEWTGYPSMVNMLDGRVLIPYYRRHRKLVAAASSPRAEVVASILNVKDYVPPMRPPSTEYFRDDADFSEWNNKLIGVNDETTLMAVHGYDRKTIYFRSNIAGTLTIYVREFDGGWQALPTVTIAANTLEVYSATWDAISIKIAFSAAATITAWYTLQQEASR